MLKFTISAALAMGLIFVDANDAAARSRGGSVEFMEFVAPTTIPASETGGQQVSLCHLIKKHTALFIPLFYQSEGYVLAENSCNTESYYALTAADLALAQSLGHITTDIPAAPSISITRQIPALGLGALVIFGVFATIRQAMRKRVRLAEMGKVSPFAQRMLEVLCHAAKSDGKTDNSEVAMIMAVAGQLTGGSFTADQVRRMIDLSENALQSNAFAKFGKGLTDDQKNSLMRGALMVLGADRQMAPAEQKFLNGLAGGLGFTQSRFDLLLSAMQRPAHA